MLTIFNICSHFIQRYVGEFITTKFEIHNGQLVTVAKYENVKKKESLYTAFDVLMIIMTNLIIIRILLDFSA